MRRLVIESPYAGDVERNTEFARNVCKHALSQGYAPYASHLFYTQMLDDTNPTEREMGIAAGLAWSAEGHIVWFCLREDETLSAGMHQALRVHVSRNRLGGSVEIWDMTFTQEGKLLHAARLT